MSLMNLLREITEQKVAEIGGSSSYEVNASGSHYANLTLCDLDVISVISLQSKVA